MKKRYQSFADQFHLENATLKQRISRDVRLIGWLLQAIRMWVKGRPVRAEFTRCQETGKPFYVDPFSGPPAPAATLETEPHRNRHPDGRAT